MVLKQNPDLKGVPSAYHDLALAFSEKEASQLPPHRPGDCAIEFLPGAVAPRGRVYPLSQPETDAMKAYIDEQPRVLSLLPLLQLPRGFSS